MVYLPSLRYTGHSEKGARGLDGLILCIPTVRGVFRAFEGWDKSYRYPSNNNQNIA